MSAQPYYMQHGPSYCLLLRSTAAAMAPPQHTAVHSAAAKETCLYSSWGCKKRVNTEGLSKDGDDMRRFMAAETPGLFKAARRSC